MRWIKSVFHGTLNGVEEFQHQINWGHPGADPDIGESDALAFANQLKGYWATAAAVATGGVSLQSMMNPATKYIEIGVTECTQTDATDASGEGGNLEQSFPTQWAAYAVGSEVAGTGGTASLPFEVSCAATLQTDHRGASGRGRLYLPPFVTGMMGSGGLYAAGVAEAVGGCLGSLFEAVEAATDYVPVVVSRRRIILNEVTSVSVGKVPDSQRRRRRSQDEARVLAWTA